MTGRVQISNLLWAPCSGIAGGGARRGFLERLRSASRRRRGSVAFARVYLLLMKMQARLGYLTRVYEPRQEGRFSNRTNTCVLTRLG